MLVLGKSRGLADTLSRHVNFFQRKNSLRGRKIFSRRHVGRTMQILPTIVEKAYQLAPHQISTAAFDSIGIQ